MRRYNSHSAGSLGWPFPVLNYKCIFQIKYTEAILCVSTRKLLWFEITKMPIAVLKTHKTYSVINYNFQPLRQISYGKWEKSRSVLFVLMIARIPSLFRVSTRSVSTAFSNTGKRSLPEMKYHVHCAEKNWQCWKTG